MIEEVFGITERVQRQNQYWKTREEIRLKPYSVEAPMFLRYMKQTSYWQLLEGDTDIKGAQQIKKIGFAQFQDVLFFIEGIIEELNLKWQFWRHNDEIISFMNLLREEMSDLERDKQKDNGNTAKICQWYKKMRTIKKWNHSEVIELVDWLNDCLHHPYLCRSEVILSFVEHCLPGNLWNLTIFQQVKVDPRQNKSSQYLTVTFDGILRSKDNLMRSRVKKMVPFTNQFTFDIKIQQKNIIFTASSFANESFTVNFYNHHMRAINLFIGVRRALTAQALYDNLVHRFQSFSKKRLNCYAKLYNDGKQYFEDMYRMLNEARSQVLITDWWLTPYILLKRPHKVTNKWYRLDGILKKIADRGVKVFIILFREPVNLLANDSEQAHFYLESLSRNIRVRRHPIIPQLWSHHQKCCIIDQTYGFMGGLDLCYGRWDTPDHFITNVNDYWSSADYTNERLRAFPPGTTQNYKQSPIDQKTQPRMPWHDIGLHVQGDAVIDMVRHFVQYWNYVDQQKKHDYFTLIRNIGKRCERSYKYESIDSVEKNQNFFEDEEIKPKTCGEKIKMMCSGTASFFRGVQRRLPELFVEIREGHRSGNMQLQLCRSASQWSIGAKKTEDSIHQAYQGLIQESEHFIYIQNQFFMGQKNHIVKCLANRIRRAHVNKQEFKVLVMMPLLPGFDGDIEDRKCAPLRAQVYNQFEAINRGENSLFKQLDDLENFNIFDYIFFFGLRGHASLKGKPITEIIYIHSKLMIVDDKRAIIGSANINDRSLLGNRDSELAMVIEENNGDIKGKKIEAFIFDLRKRLFQEHFSMSADETENFLKKQIWYKMIATAKNNTIIYRRLFGCYPDDTITTGYEIQERKQHAHPEEYQDLKQKLIGHAVEFPLNFMKDEDLSLDRATKQGILGEQAFL